MSSLSLSSPSSKPYPANEKKPKPTNTHNNSFITSHLTHHHDLTLLTLFPTIPALNTYGHSHLTLSLTVLAQNLKNIDTPHAALKKCTTYLSFFVLGPEEFIKRAKEAAEGEGEPLGFSFEQGKKIIELFFSEGEGSSDRGVAVQAGRAREARILELTEWLY